MRNPDGELGFKHKDSMVVREVEITQKALPVEYPVLLKGITKVYGSGRTKRTAINDLNISIKPGEVFGLLGVNGAGKSTTFKILTRDVIATSGSAYLSSYNIEKQFEEARKSIGYCPQFGALFEVLTVKEEI